MNFSQLYCSELVWLFEIFGDFFYLLERFGQDWRRQSFNTCQFVCTLLFIFSCFDGIGFGGEFRCYLLSEEIIVFISEK